MSEVGTGVERDRREALRAPLGRLRRMLEIRAVEDTIKGLFADGLIAGSTHTCQGQEAIAVGVAATLRSSDSVGCTYRGHGHALALGMTPLAVFAEILGRSEGCVGGIGGSMHLCNRSIGLMPTMAIVGAGIPIAVGAAWAAQARRTGDVAVGLFGDGASNTGAFHEALNLAAVWSLPAVLICENNLYGEYSRIDTTTAVGDIAQRAGGYGMPGQIVDGQDLAAVMAAVGAAVDRARDGGGPTLLEMKTYRYSGHSRSDPATYRPEGELEHWQARDPIALYEQYLLGSGVAAEVLTESHRAMGLSVEEAVTQAKASSLPAMSEMFAHVLAGDDRASGSRR